MIEQEEDKCDHNLVKPCENKDYVRAASDIVTELVVGLPVVESLDSRFTLVNGEDFGGGEVEETRGLVGKLLEQEVVDQVRTPVTKKVWNYRSALPSEEDCPTPTKPRLVACSSSSTPGGEELPSPSSLADWLRKVRLEGVESFGEYEENPENRMESPSPEPEEAPISDTLHIFSLRPPPGDHCSSSPRP